MGDGRRRSALLLSSLVLAALPKCPACVLAYVGLAGVISIPPAAWSSYRLSLLVSAFVLALGVLVAQAWRRRAGCCSTGRR
jgi:hypothetical protein